MKLERLNVMNIEKILNRCKLKLPTPNWLEYFFYALLALGVMLFYKYWDFKSLTVWSTSILDCIVDGNLYDYYSVIHTNAYGAPHEYCGFNYLSLIPWAIWNIPIWIVQRFCHIRIVDHTVMMLWSQLFLAFLLIIILFYSRKIIEFFNEDHNIKEWSSYLIVTCPLTFLGIFIAGQSDLIVITTTVIAIYYLLKDKQIIFLLLMAYSISAKPFFIFSFIAVILLIEKNVLFAFLKVCSSFIPMVLFDIIYKNAPLYQESINGSTANNIIQKTITNCIGATGGSASIVIMCLVVIYFMAYCISYKAEDKVRKQYIIYFMFAPMAIYFAFANYEFYRRIFLIPFLIIMMAINSKFWMVNVILEKILSFTGVFLSLCGAFTAYLECVNRGMMARLGIEQDISKCRYPSIAHLMGGKFGENGIMIQTIGISIFVAVTVILLFINFPPIARKLSLPELKNVRAVYWLDMIFMGGVILILFLCYFNIFA